MEEMIDFTSCPRVVGRAYNGANGKKIAVRYNGEIWILKFSPNVSDRPNEQSYSNSCISEHLGSTVFRMLGIDVQETMFGIHVNGKTKIVCACKDFTSPGVRLYDFCSIKNTVIDSETGGTGTELSDVLETIELQTFLDPVVVLKRFWQMFIVDALLGNFDRHNGNWGFLTDEDTEQSTLAPVYDCGSCLLPQADDTIMRKCLDDENEMNARILTFPASMLKINGKKINYYDFLHSAGAPKGLCVERDNLLDGINQLDIEGLVINTPSLTNLQQDFYISYISKRRMLLF